MCRIDRLGWRLQAEVPLVSVEGGAWPNPAEVQGPRMHDLAASQRTLDIMSDHHFVEVRRMHYEDFMASLDHDGCPSGLDPRLQALWYDAKGEWDTAHEIVAQLNDVTAARVHAYLHRKEGDDWNARYWHRRAGSTFPEKLSLHEEWSSLLQELVD